MNIAVLSGKGGTGKTLLSVNLAYAAGRSCYIDCDVEEPNGHLYFGGADQASRIPIFRKVPVIDDSKCTACRICVDFCRFSALAMTGNTVVVFDSICHSCGGCAILCPSGAIIEEDRPIGEISDYVSGSVRVLSGQMRVGEAFGIPIIRSLFSRVTDADDLLIVDCPPGSSCAAMESIRDADLCLIVAEPTIFGAHNLDMVVHLAQFFNKPIGVVLNKCEEGRPNPSEQYCQENDLFVVKKIPFDKNLGLHHSEARIAAQEENAYLDLFIDILNQSKTFFCGGKS